MSHSRQRAVLRQGLAFSLVALAMNLSCTKEVPDATEQDTLSGSPSGVNSPETGTSQEPSQKSTDASNDEVNDQESQTPSSEVSEQDSQTPSSEASEQDSQVPSDQACEDHPSRECVQDAPNGWKGPFRVNRSDTLKKVERCKSPAPQVEMLYEDWIADQAKCSGCTPSVLLPPCQPIRLVGHKDSGSSNQPSVCSPNNETKSVQMSYDECRSMRSLLTFFPPSTQEYSYKMPKTLHKQASCDKGEPVKVLPPIRAKTYWRVCENPKELPACKAEGMSCLKKRKETAEAACIYSLLRTECPDRSIYRHKIEAATEFKDARSCSKCSARLVRGTKSDDFECELDLKLFQDDQDGCHPDSASSSPSKDELRGVCQKHKVIWDRDQFFYAKKSTPKYSGSCEKVGWEPIGSVRPSKWATVCCSI